MKEREIYLKGSMENLIAKSFCYFSSAGTSFAIHIKDKTGKADISVLDNRRLSREITKRQVRGKSLTIRYRGGRTKKCCLSTDQYIRGPFGEKVDFIRYGYLADSLMQMRCDMFSGRGEISAFSYEAENERSLSAVAREAAASRERNLKEKNLEQFQTWWEEQQLLQALKRQKYHPELSDKEKLAAGRPGHRISCQSRRKRSSGIFWIKKNEESRWWQTEQWNIMGKPADGVWEVRRISRQSFV